MNRRDERTLSWLGLLLILFTLVPPGNVTAQSGQITACAEAYIVQADDWLSKIADKRLGNRTAYLAIVAATNQQHAVDTSFAQITNPNLIKAGWKLCIPAGTEAQNLLASVTSSVAAAPTMSAVAPAVYTLDDFVQEFNFGPEVNPDWIYTSPEPLAKFDILPEHQARRDQYGYRANYLWNEYLADRYYYTPGLFDMLPPEIYLYSAPWQTAYPRYRYPPNVTLPTGLTTNQFGWRGPPITLNKPPRTIRIACVGASTTVDGHSLPFFYPELLQHWLNLWGQENDYHVRFEVINAGREGIGSHDIAAVVQYELLPLEVDYVIYYEGANQFNPRTMVSYPADVTFGQPPPGLVPNFTNVESNDKSLLDHLSEYSAIAARARSLIEGLSLSSQEPPKPEQLFFLPEGLDELKPDRAHLGEALDLKKILRDLDQIKQELDRHEVTMVLATFDWFVYDGLILDPARHRTLYGYLNRVYWPISYANMRRMADFQNRVFKVWADENRVSVVDVAEQMPRQPDLYDDAIHNTQLGVRIRAWLNFEALAPLLKKDIERQILPQPDQERLDEHPYLTPVYSTKVLSATGAGQ